MTLLGQKSHSTQMLIQNDHKRLYSGTVAGTVHVWDLESQSDLYRLQGHLTKCTALANDGSEILVTGSQDCKVKVWDQRQGKNVLSFKNHTGTINTL